MKYIIGTFAIIGLIITLWALVNWCQLPNSQRTDIYKGFIYLGIALIGGIVIVASFIIGSIVTSQAIQHNNEQLLQLFTHNQEQLTDDNQTRQFPITKRVNKFKALE